MSLKINRIKYRCERCKRIYWSEQAVKVHLKKVHKVNFKDLVSGDDWTTFYEPELCPFVYPDERVICNCLTQVSVSIEGIAICPSLIDRRDLIERHRIVSVKSGSHIGKIEYMEMLAGNRLRLIFRNVGGERFLINTTKTITYEILKRSCSKELSDLSKKTGASNRPSVAVWEGFLYAVERKQILNSLFKRVIESELLYSMNIKNNGVISNVKTIKTMKRDGV